MELIFTIFLAGCSHDLSACSELEMIQLETASLAQCEAALDARLIEAASDWPVTHGSCIPGGGTDMPEWYPQLMLAETDQRSLEQPSQTH